MRRPVPRGFCESAKTTGVLAALLLVSWCFRPWRLYMWFGGPEVTLLDAVYMAVITITTVGYGEIVDTMPAGIAAFQYFLCPDRHRHHASTFFPSRPPSLWKASLTTFFGDAKMMKQIRDMNDHLIICGAGETGAYLSEGAVRTGNVFCGY